MSKKWNKGGHGQKDSNGGADPPPPEKCLFVQPRIQAVRIEPSSEDNERYSSEESNRAKQLELSAWLNRITAGGAAISFLALVALAISLYYTRRATETAQREFESSQRPWLSVSARTGILEIAPTGTPILHVTIQLGNVGHSIAANVTSHFVIIANGNTSGSECEDVSKELHSTAKDRPRQGVVVFPNQPGEEYFPVFLMPGKERQYADILKNPSGVPITFMFDACYSYNSTIDDLSHFTELIYRIEAPNINDPPLQTPGNHNVNLVLDINGARAQ